MQKFSIDFGSTPALVEAAILLKTQTLRDYLTCAVVGSLIEIRKHCPKCLCHERSNWSIFGVNKPLSRTVEMPFS